MTNINLKSIICTKTLVDCFIAKKHSTSVMIRDFLAQHQLAWTNLWEQSTSVSFFVVKWFDGQMIEEWDPFHGIGFGVNHGLGLWVNRGFGFGVYGRTNFVESYFLKKNRTLNHPSTKPRCTIIIITVSIVGFQWTKALHNLWTNSPFKGFFINDVRQVKGRGY